MIRIVQDPLQCPAPNMPPNNRHFRVPGLKFGEALMNTSEHENENKSSNSNQLPIPFIIFTFCSRSKNGDNVGWLRTSQDCRRFLLLMFIAPTETERSAHFLLHNITSEIGCQTQIVLGEAELKVLSNSSNSTPSYRRLYDQNGTKRGKENDPRNLIGRTRNLIDSCGKTGSGSLAGLVFWMST